MVKDYFKRWGPTAKPDLEELDAASEEYLR